MWALSCQTIVVPSLQVRRRWSPRGGRLVSSSSLGCFCVCWARIVAFDRLRSLRCKGAKPIPRVLSATRPSGRCARTCADVHATRLPSGITSLPSAAVSGLESQAALSSQALSSDRVVELDKDAPQSIAQTAGGLSPCVRVRAIFLMRGGLEALP